MYKIYLKKQFSFHEEYVKRSSGHLILQVDVNTNKFNVNIFVTFSRKYTDSSFSKTFLQLTILFYRKNTQKEAHIQRASNHYTPPHGGSRFRSSRIKPHFQQSTHTVSLFFSCDYCPHSARVSFSFLPFSSEFSSHIRLSFAEQSTTHTQRTTHIRTSKAFEPSRFTKIRVNLWKGSRAYRSGKMHVVFPYFFECWPSCRGSLHEMAAFDLIASPWFTQVGVPTLSTLESSVGNAQAPFTKRGKFREKTCRRC